MMKIREGIDTLDELSLIGNGASAKSQLINLLERGMESLEALFLKIYNENSFKAPLKKSTKIKNEEDSEREEICLLNEDAIMVLSHISSFIYKYISLDSEEQFRKIVVMERVEVLGKTIGNLNQESITFERKGFYSRNTHPFIAYYKTLMKNLILEKKNIKSVFPKKIATQIVSEIYEDPMAQLYEADVLILSKMKRNVAERKDYGDLFIAFDVLENIYRFQETVQFEKLRDILAEFSAFAVQSCNDFLDDIKSNSSVSMGSSSVPINGTVHELTTNVDVI